MLNADIASTRNNTLTVKQAVSMRASNGASWECHHCTSCYTAVFNLRVPACFYHASDGDSIKVEMSHRVEC
jgi:hypothetical protein